MRRAEIDFLNKYCNLSEKYKEVYDEHYDFNEEIVPHVLMSELTYKLIELYKSKNMDLVIQTLKFVDHEFVISSKEVKNMIVVSMLENFPPSGDQCFDLRNLLSKQLRNELEQVNY